ncbi:hypothetical protein A3K73_06145 [Candidatus Pacearchaeota archaeon RBG_13_36_9]|nr:MAG: hypothetical protein A3K73_06145 [Candidatus Pacearchaeota archaeon RBG_13_36_9]
MRNTRKLRAYDSRRRTNFFPAFSVTTWLIIVNVAFFVIFAPLLAISQDYAKYVAIQPEAIMHGKYLWTIITNVFMHAGFAHLLINMFVLFSLGGLCEKIIGRKRYFWFYLVSGIIAGLSFVFFAYFFGNNPLGERIFGAPDNMAVGASGAIFAVAGLFMILTPRLRFTIIFLPFFSLPAYIMIPLVLVLTWIISVSAGFGVGNTAHFGGFLVGVLFALYLRHKYKRKTKMIERYFSR